MNSNKNILDTWVDAQTKSVNNLVETSKKIQKSVQKGNLMQETTDIYKNWLEGQKNIVEETMHLKKTKSADKSTGTDAADMFTNWMSSQTEMAKNWFENLNKFMPGTHNNSFAPLDMFNETTKMYQQWNNLYNNLISQTNGQVTNFKNLFQGVGNMNNSFSQMLNSSAVYAKMFEAWQPMMQQLQQNMKSAEGNGNQFAEMMKAFNPEKLQEVMNSIFQFAPADQFKNLYEQMNGYAHRFQSQQHEMQQQWVEQVKQIGNLFPEGTSSFTNAFLNNPAMKQMEQAFAPLTRLMPHGKEKESFDTWMLLKDKFGQYWTSYNEMQYQVYTTGQKAMEKVMLEAIGKAKENKGQPVDFKEFYNQWLNTTETLMIESFGGDEFSKVQGELLTIGSEIKNIMEKQMERTLEGLPLVPRSEADEMAQTIHDLKSRVRSLEKQLRNQATQVAEVVEAVEATAEKAHTAKAHSNNKPAANHKPAANNKPAAKK